MADALENLRVLDFSRVLAGPFATMMLADFGATVTKVERPGGGDETRSWGPPYDERGEATYFQSVNRNKHAIVLDLRNEGHERRARAGPRGGRDRRELPPGGDGQARARLRAAPGHRPALIYCSITGFGGGAGARLPGYDLLAQALGGLMSITGEPDGAPQKVGVALVDVLAGLFSTVGILAALRHRDATGEGQLVEVNLLWSLLAALVNQASAYTVAGVVPERMGNAHPSITPYAPYRTADGELVLAAGNERQFAALCEVIGAPELAPDARFESNGERVNNREALHDELEARLAARPASEWAPLMTEARVPAGVVNDVRRAFALAQTLGLEPTVSIARDDGGAVLLTRNPVTLSRTPATYRCAPPSLPRLRGVRNVAAARCGDVPCTHAPHTRPNGSVRADPPPRRSVARRTRARRSGPVRIRARTRGTAGRNVLCDPLGHRRALAGRPQAGHAGTGDCFGEIDPMELEPQRFSVIATSPMRLLTFSAYGIGRLCSAIPNVRDRLLAYLPRDPSGCATADALWPFSA